MKVYILSDVVPYEGHYIIGVYDSPEKAMDARPSKRWKLRSEGLWERPDYDVMEWTVNAEKMPEV